LSGGVGRNSPGRIALYDRHSGELSSGDVVYDGELLDELPGSDIPAYIAFLMNGCSNWRSRRYTPVTTMALAATASPRFWLSTWNTAVAPAALLRPVHRVAITRVI